MLETKIKSKQIKEKALEIGFNGVGISKAEELPGFNHSLERWLKSGYHAGMQYMERNKEKRCDSTLLVEGAKSVISFLTSYYPQNKQPENIPQISKYAYGIDYHFVLKERMQLLWDYIKESFPELEGRMFVDSAPVSDKLLATKAGLGWIGKNSCLINKEMGSFVFICELIINIELDYDEPYASNFCGTCTKCIDACPTKAIVQPGVIDSNKCISYLTIENKDESIPEIFKGQLQNRIFGCDICQDVCPWNKKPLITNINEFKPSDGLFTLDIDAWKTMDSDKFNQLFKKSPLKRAKFKGLLRNVSFLTKTK
ncbi:MAG: tRNA epoxyqueuosine(34) reductase QueG [Salinivirgaceae bacterium]|nr:tRNA epoxyqueuosine(34) reductase QueG [Salinivirgaceae bacterium]